MTRAGQLWLIVGASGVGKDSLIEGAKTALVNDPGFLFPRREITRPADAGGEDHIAVTPEDFAARRRSGGYALCWRAHGFDYGVPGLVVEAVAAGRAVVVNGSRGALGQARRRFPGLRIVEIVVPLAILRARLRARGRETPAEIEARLLRAAALTAAGGDVLRFSNHRPLAESIDAFVGLLTGSGGEGSVGPDG